NLYPLATLTDTSEVTGREGWRVADYRRERSWWQATTSVADNEIAIDLGAGNSAQPDALWLDRGHNLWTHVVAVRYSDTGAGGSYTTLINYTLPASTVVGGDPTSATTPSITEEGAAWGL